MSTLASAHLNHCLTLATLERLTSHGEITVGAILIPRGFIVARCAIRAPLPLQNHFVDLDPDRRKPRCSSSILRAGISLTGWPTSLFVGRIQITISIRPMTGRFQLNSPLKWRPPLALCPREGVSKVSPSSSIFGIRF